MKIARLETRQNDAVNCEHRTLGSVSGSANSMPFHTLAVRRASACDHHILQQLACNETG